MDTLKVSQLSGARTNRIYCCRYQRGNEVLRACCFPQGIVIACLPESFPCVAVSLQRSMLHMPRPKSCSIGNRMFGCTSACHSVREQLPAG